MELSRLYEKLKTRSEVYFEADKEIPLSQHAVLFIVVGILTFFIVWANIATLDEVTRGEGKIIPSSRVKKIQGVDKGQVEEILVREGQRVKQGDPLIRISAIEAQSEYQSNFNRVLGIKATIARLKAEAEGSDTVEFPEDVIANAPENVVEERKAFESNRRSLEGQVEVLDQQLSQREQQVREIQTKINDVRSVINLSRQEKQMIEPLVEKGAAPKIELIQLERGIKQTQQELNSLTTSLPRAKLAVEEARAKIKERQKELQARAQANLSEKLIELNALEDNLDAFKDRESRTTLSSPVDGIIQSINENLGGVVEPGELLIEVVPVDDNLLVEAQIKPSDIAFLHPGQKAKIKITSYDFSIYGGLDGELIDISADSITDRQGNTFYRITLQTEQSGLMRNGENLPIIPGMVASVDILTGKKTVMEYIMKPFIKTVDKAMNER